ncbi:MAG: LPS export ABC transporter ATP-binding protein [Candidatus Muiribacterium halophilum]|uniref:LPS export ABC transporter ATP-binding protein n=1 Tax=Muiribacterium halophilum TaxID=2053465 RepID=A0A2N5ZLI8_MUIH1|nr:MAG: LPS export ABC transporter ATP-binding protein [Candidatus Muirbacterium halophilum]
MTKTIKADELTKIYGGRKVVNNVSISLSKGEITGLLGPNGAGKTTSFYMIVGIVSPKSGNIFLNDQNITDIPMYKRARLGIGYLPQEPSVFRKLTVWQNILAILQFTELTKKEQHYRAEELLDELKITHIRDSLGVSLSGGERRRVEIARAISTSPDFLLLDEPFAGVDPIAVADIQEIISELKKSGLGILITDHNVRETLSITDRAYVMNSGEILVEGDAEMISNDPKARQFYLGEKFRL